MKCWQRWNNINSISNCWFLFYPNSRNNSICKYRFCIGLYLQSNYFSNLGRIKTIFMFLIVDLLAAAIIHNWKLAYINESNKNVWAKKYFHCLQNERKQYVALQTVSRVNYIDHHLFISVISTTLYIPTRLYTHQKHQ